MRHVRRLRRLRHTGRLAATVLFGPLLASALFLSGLFLSGQAWAQGPAYRAPVSAQVQSANATGQVNTTGQAKAAGQAAGAAAPKFPNKDTAANRQDYELGSPDSGGIVLGRDAVTGETLTIRVPPKKSAPPQDVEKPIEVKPVVPLIWR